MLGFGCWLGNFWRYIIFNIIIWGGNLILMQHMVKNCDELVKYWVKVCTFIWYDCKGIEKYKEEIYLIRPITDSIRTKTITFDLTNLFLIRPKSDLAKLFWFDQNYLIQPRIFDWTNNKTWPNFMIWPTIWFDSTEILKSKMFCHIWLDSIWLD